MPSNSFERFYYEKVALGEGCGCAEQIIGTRDVEARSQKAAMQNASQKGHGDRLAWLRKLFPRRLFHWRRQWPESLNARPQHSLPAATADNTSTGRE